MRIRKKNIFNPRDFIGFVLFLLIIGGIFYSVHEQASNTAYICLAIIAVIIMLFWLSPTITELIIVFKKASLQIKQGEKQK